MTPLALPRLALVLLLAAPAAAGQEEALIPDYVEFTVISPPAELELHPFYKKYVDAQGIPVVSSENTDDEALLAARDIVQFMLADRPDLRRELIRKKWKYAIMASDEVTYDIPEHAQYRLLPAIDDERLTPQQVERYNEPGGVGTMTGADYWNGRGRGFGGEPDGENTTSGAEEGLLGYPRRQNRYFGQSLAVHEFSHGIMRGAIYTVDPEYRQAVEEVYAAAKEQGLRSAQGYNGNNLNEYWAYGVESYTFASGTSSETLLSVDPRLHEIVKRVIPPQPMPGNVYRGLTRGPGRRAGGAPQPQQTEPLLTDYIEFTVKTPPEDLGLDPVYRKHVDAHGIPVVGSEDVPGSALLVARDIVIFMLSERPDLRKQLVRMKWKVAVTAEGDAPRDEGSTTTTPEGNLLGYRDSPDFGRSVLVRELAKAMIRGAMPIADPELRDSIEDAFAAARAQDLSSTEGDNGTDAAGYWAGGVEAYTNSGDATREGLLESDPRLFELVRQVIPSRRMLANAYVSRGQ